MYIYIYIHIKKLKKSEENNSNIEWLICGNKMPTRCNRGFYCRSYCLLNMFRAPLRGELSYLAPLSSENIPAPYFKQCFFRGGGYYPPRQSNTTPPSPKTEVTNILFYILNFASIIKFKM